jgi:hypothetical protein
MEYITAVVDMGTNILNNLKSSKYSKEKSILII